MIAACARAAVRNPVAANLAMLAIVLSGVLVFQRMPREVFPDSSLDQIEVQTRYRGASAEEIERLITRPLESAIGGVEGVDEILSTTREGISRITLTVDVGEELSTVIGEVRDAVRREAPELPEEAQEPVVLERRTVFSVIAVMVHGHASEGELRRVAEEHERALEALPGVSGVFTTGLREPRLWIEVDPLALERFGLTLVQVAEVIRAKVLDAPLGSLTTPGGDWLLRVDAEVDWAADLAALPVVARPDGALVRLSQLATVSDTFQRRLTSARYNGLPCAHLEVHKRSDSDMIDVARSVREYVASANQHMPDGMRLGTYADLSVYVKNRLAVMTESGSIGLVLVIAALLCFLDWRVAAVTVLGIPIAFLGGILLAGSAGITLNMLTMFALIVVLGMLVDDAIVVGENACRLMEEGLPPAEAAVVGTAEVGRPVVATILTSIAAFLPILMVEGTTGRFMRPLPLVVSACLAVSLFEALTILPSHLAHWGGVRAGRERAREQPVRRWYDPLRDGYARLLALALRWRYVTLTAAVAVALAVGAVARYRIPFVFFDDFESKLLYVTLRLRPDASIEETDRVARWAEERVMALPASELESVNTLLGVAATDVSNYQLAQNLAQVWVELHEGEGRTLTTAEVIETLRQALTDAPPSLDAIEIDQPQAGPAGRSIEMSVRGPDLARLAEISARLQAQLSEFAGIRDVHDNLDSGKRGVSVVLTDRGRSLGFSEALLAAELRSAFEGTTCAHLRRGSDDVEVILKLPERVRQRRSELDRLRVSTPLGERVPLTSVAELVEEVTPAVITHDARERSVTISADVNKAEGNAAEIAAALTRHWEEIRAGYPGYRLEPKGDVEETARSIAGLLVAGAISLAAIYVILGTLFRSFAQPLVIMFVIPFAAIGMVLGHGVMDRPITLLSLIGLLALTGVVVNDSLILVDFANRRRKTAAGLTQALVEAGRLRFRPIALTSITTMAGLSPLTFFVSGDARFLQPMAISLFYGLAVATVLILVIVPCAYAVMEDILAWVKRPRESLARARSGEPLHP